MLNSDSKRRMRAIQPFLLSLLLLMLAACAKPGSPCDDPAGCYVIYPGETILFGVIAPLSGDQSCSEVRTTLENLQKSITGKKIKGHPIDISIWDTYSTDKAIENGLVASFSQPTLIASLVLMCDSSSRSETLRAWLDNNFLILTDPSQLIEGINQLDQFAVERENILFIPRSAWMVGIIEKQLKSTEGYDER